MFSYINRIQELSEVLITKKEDRNFHDRLARGIYLRAVYNLLAVDTFILGRRLNE